MAIDQTLCTSFKREVLEGVHDFTTHTFKIALYTSAASLGAATTAYTASEEVVGTGYTATGAVIYNDTAAGDPAVAVLDFGIDRSSTAASFVVSFPTATASSAIVRLV
jgi:hypothetical protein